MKTSINYEDALKKHVSDLKSCAECIINNAESIVGSERFQRGIRVTITLDNGEAPNINVDKDIMPEAFAF